MTHKPLSTMPNNIILFDGVCNFCNRAVNFILVHDEKEIFSFTPIQSKTGKMLSEMYGISINDPDSFLLIRNEKVYTKSSAALVIAQELNQPWRWISVLKFIPERGRDYIYSIIAKHRYKWFGKTKECRIPTPDQKKRFIL